MNTLSALPLSALFALLTACSVPYVPDTSNVEETSNENSALEEEAEQKVVEASDAIESIECTAQRDNVLRYDCNITTNTDAEVYIEVTSDDGQLSFVTATTSGLEHEQTLWGLRTNTTYHYSVGLKTDSNNELVGDVAFTTGDDDVLDSVRLQATGNHGEAGVYTIVPTTCDSALVFILDEEAQIVWYQSYVEYGNKISAIEFTDDKTILIIVNDKHLIEYSLSGKIISHIRDTDLKQLIHHEVVKHDDYFIAIAAEKITDQFSHKDYILDSIRAFDSEGNTLASIRSDEIFDLYSETWHNQPDYFSSEYSNAFYAFQANAFDIDDNGDITVSFKSINTLVKINGNTSSANFGEVIWELAADNSGDLTSQSTVGIKTTFEGQHHVNYSPSGNLMMFDNLGGDRSRIIEFEINESSLKANAINEYIMDNQCGIGGVATRFGDSTFGVCGEEKVATEFDANGYVIWNFSLECDQGYTRPLYRIIPVSSLW